MQRITKKTEFDEVYQKNKKLNNTCFFIYYSYSEEFKVGVVVSKKVGNAVVRHYKTRQMREILRKLPEFIYQNISVVINLKPAAVNYSFLNLHKELIFSLDKIAQKVDYEITN